MFSESETESPPGVVEPQAPQAAVGGLVDSQAAGGLAASQAAESWVTCLKSMTEASRTKLGRQARNLVSMSACSGMGSHIAAMKVGMGRRHHNVCWLIEVHIWYRIHRTKSYDV